MNAGFSMDEPILAFPNRKEYDEYFYKGIYSAPYMPTMEVLEKAKSIQDILDNIPDKVEVEPDIEE